MTLTESTKSATEANLYYSKQIMGNLVEDKYGDKIDKLAGTIEDSQGKEVVNETRSKQIEAVITTLSQDVTNTLNSELKGIDVSYVKNTGDLNKYLNNLNAGFTIDNDKELHRKYAEMFLKDYDINELEFKNG